MKTRIRLLALLSALGLLASGGTITFAAVEDSGFADVAADAWYAGAAAYCREYGMMSGTAETSFAPNATINRAMLVTALWRMAGSGAAEGTMAYVDVPAGTWYTEAVVWAVQEKIVSGYGDTVFGANDPVTREQIATMLYRYEEYKNGGPDVSGTLSFADSAGIAGWASDAVLWASEAGIVAGRPGNLFDPKAGATRAEVAVMLHRYLIADEHVPVDDANDPEPTSEPAESPENGIVVDQDGMISVNVTIDGTLFAAKFYDNESARAILAQMPFSLHMDDYAGQEKVKGLAFSLPSAATDRPAAIRSGDLYLWSGTQLVLFYTAFSNSYSYVPVGYIEDPAGLVDALGSGSVTVTFSHSAM